MELLFFCPRWGSEQVPWPTFVKKVKDAGYQGIEWGLPAGTPERELNEAVDLINKNRLLFIPQHWDTIDSDFNRHHDNYACWLERVAALPADKINSQTGKDYFTVEQNTSLFKLAAAHTKKTGVPVVHETHRGKCLYAAHVAAAYFEKLPGLRITLDISHWVTVAETYLNDQKDAVQTALQRADHLHARIGHPQGSQITDPRQTQWQEGKVTFFGWWKELIRLKENSGLNTFTITPEFGPHPYMAMLPSGAPVCDQWAVNEYIMEALKLQREE